MLYPLRRGMLLSLLALALLAVVGTVTAHGVRITYTIALTVQLQAEFDNGDPMADAQVLVYAPDDPATPWLTGQADENGRFSFVPDPTLPGTWDVQVRSAGHGDMIHIPVEEQGPLSGGTGFTPAQIVLMAAAVIWGFVGTALYFSGRSGNPQVKGQD